MKRILRLTAAIFVFLSASYTYLLAGESAASSVTISFKDALAVRSGTAVDGEVSALTYLAVYNNGDSNSDALSEIMWDDKNNDYSHNDLKGLLELYESLISNSSNRLAKKNMNIIEFSQRIPYLLVTVKNKKNTIKALINKKFPLRNLISISDQCESIENVSKEEKSRQSKALTSSIKGLRYYSPHLDESSEQFDRIDKKLLDTKEQVHETIIHILEKGEKLDTLADKTGTLKEQAKQFERNGNNLKNSQCFEWFKKLTCCLMGTACVAGVIAAAVLILI